MRDLSSILGALLLFFDKTSSNLSAFQARLVQFALKKHKKR